ncbi:MAG TPA: hypothetical protein VNL13_01935 [Sulfolobales archaeon]|nr:hypothetical protein [Sulfolobales archaeon]
MGGEGSAGRRWISAPLLMGLGLALLIIPFVIAIIFFFVFEPLAPRPGSSLNEALVDASFSLISIASRLAFLGIAVWVGSIVLRNAVELMRGRG